LQESDDDGVRAFIQGWNDAVNGIVHAHTRKMEQPGHSLTGQDLAMAAIGSAMQLAGRHFFTNNE
jgi:hypothetical protein